jgi:hypothetical protein
MNPAVRGTTSRIWIGINITKQERIMTEKLSFEKLIPSSWFNDATKSSIWVVGCV